jgi:hypothetical protein
MLTPYPHFSETNYTHQVISNEFPSVTLPTLELKKMSGFQTLEPASVASAKTLWANVGQASCLSSGLKVETKKIFFTTPALERDR